MIENKYLELLHAELDGVNTPQESARLAAYLAVHPEAQRLYDELRGMANVLAEVKPVTPPASLQYAIMKTIAERAAKPNQLTAIKSWWAEIFEPRFALSFAGGLAVGVLLFALAMQFTAKAGVSDSQLYGTIGAPQNEERSAESKSFDIQHETANGEMKWRREGERLVTEITLAAAEAFELAVLFDANAMKCNGISASDGGTLPNAVLQEGRLQLAHSGARSYRISFQLRSEAAPAARVQFQRNGVLVYDEEVLFSAH